MKSRIHSILPAILITVFLVSCKKTESSPDPSVKPAQSIANVAYGSDPQQKMDVYLPAGRNSATKVMILIHGGSWNGGDKSDFDAYVDTLKRREPSYAIFNINYRLANTTNLFPAQEEDVKSAIEFILSKSAEYVISEKLVLVGASAGAHLALLQAYKHPNPAVKAVIDFFGPTDLVALYNNPPNVFVPLILQQVTGGTPSSHATLYQQSSPVNFVTPQAPPTMILHGGVDPVVPIAQSLSMKAELLAKNVIHEYVVYPMEGHSWVGPNLTDSFNRIEDFLEAHVF